MGCILPDLEPVADESRAHAEHDTFENKRSRRSRGVDKSLGSGGQATVWEDRHADEHHSAPGALKICTRREKER